MAQKMKTVGIRKTSHVAWTLTYSGVVLLDSEKYLSVAQAEDAARAEVARCPERYRLHSNIGYGHLGMES